VGIKISLCYIRCTDTQTRVYQRAHAAAGTREEMSWVRKAARNSSQM